MSNLQPTRMSRRQIGLPPIDHISTQTTDAVTLPDMEVQQNPHPLTSPGLESSALNQSSLVDPSNDAQTQNPSINNRGVENPFQNPTVNHLHLPTEPRNPNPHQMRHIPNTSITNHLPYVSTNFAHSTPSSSLHSLPVASNPSTNSSHTFELQQQVQSLTQHNMRLESMLQQMLQHQHQNQTRLNETHQQITSLVSQLTQAQQLNVNLTEQLKTPHPESPTPIQDLLDFSSPPTFAAAPSSSAPQPIDLTWPTTTQIPAPQMDPGNLNLNPPPSNSNVFRNPLNTAHSSKVSQSSTSASSKSTKEVEMNKQSSTDLLLQQLIQASKAQTEFFSTRSDDMSSEGRFPSFNGKEDSDFDAWYLKVLSILASPKWGSMYDPSLQDVGPPGSVSLSLDQSLYSKLINCLSGNALNLMMAKEHLRGQGLLFLQTLKDTFSPSLTEFEVLSLEQSFARPLRGKDETIHAFAARCIKTQKTLEKYNIYSSPERMRLKFINGLGPTFSTIQTNLSLYPTWATTDMDQLIQAANLHLQTVNAIRIQNKEFKDPKAEPNLQQDKRKAHQTNPSRKEKIEKDNQRKTQIDQDIAWGIFDPRKFQDQVKPNHCVYHDCNHDNTECVHLKQMLLLYPQSNPNKIANKMKPKNVHPYATPPVPPNPVVPPPRAVPTPRPQARQVQVEDIQDDEISPINLTELQKATDELEAANHNINNINNDVTDYSSLLNCRNVSTQSHPFPISFVVDSAANPHMCNQRKAFDFLSHNVPPHLSHVTLADGTTKEPVKGIGSISFFTTDKNKTFKMRGVLYVPSLSNSLYSVQQHCLEHGCIFHVEKEQVLLSFPTFQYKTSLSQNIYLNVNTFSENKPTIQEPKIINKPEVSQIDLSNSPPLLYSNIDSTIMDINRATPGSAGIDLRNGFGSTDPIPQHQLDLKLNQLKFNKKITIKLPHQQHYSKGSIKYENDQYYFSPIDAKDTSYEISTQLLSKIIQNKQLHLGHHHLISVSDNPSTFPPIRTVDKPIHHTSANIHLTVDQIRKYFGFRNVDSILKEIKSTSTNLSITTADREPILDIGEVATIDKNPRNTHPLNLPSTPGSTVHADIIFGSGTAIGGVKYALFLVDRATRHKFLYPIKDLKQDILPAFRKFFLDIGRVPTVIHTDFDHKLMGQPIETYLIDRKCKIESAPPEHQSMNGLCERNWRSILKMARSWLASSLLPHSFWWFALKRATEVSNYIPLKIDSKLTTPHEKLYGCKPDMRNLIPIFSVAYTSYTTQHSYNVQTVKTILVGKSDKSNSLIFFHPATKQIITSARYRFDETLPSGPSFNLPYDGGLYFTKYCNYHAQTKAPTYQPTEKVYTKLDDKFTQVEVIAVPPSNSSIYTVQHPDGSIHQYLESKLSHHDPSIQPHQNDPTLNSFPKWIKHNSKCTLYLNSMSKPKHGYLIHNNSFWQFRPGNKLSNPPLDLPNLEQDIHSLTNTFQIFRGHQNFHRVTQTRSSFNLGIAAAKHVSAMQLTSHDVPTLLNHNKLNKMDKEIWDRAYAEEYNGLKNLPAWTHLTEQEYKSMQHKYKALLPTMAISCIKFDELGRPKRAKYRIVALGNLDPYQWSKQDCYAPVLSLMELRLLTALAVKFKRTLKNGDVKQAFCQAVLPPDENYVLKPPPGCPLTPPNTYWLLKRTLYGLRRSPRHWYEKAKEILESIGLHQCPNSPCLFTGTIIKDQPPIYLGLYVDDFVYFSRSDKVEKEFESQMKSRIQVDFMGRVSYFLGIRFQWRCNDNKVQVHLSQEAFADGLIQQAQLNPISTKTNTTPYKSGFPVDKIKQIPLLPQQKAKLETELRKYVGSLLWLSQGTRPDLTTITNMLAQYQANPSPQHIQYAKYVIRYIKGTKDHGIQFHSDKELKILSFLNFPIDNTKLIGITDANWGPQDQSKPRTGAPPEHLDLFKSRSMSGHIINLHGPIHWSSKRQTITATSSAEAEVYATDACVKDILFLRNILNDLKLHDQAMNPKTNIYNDNMACVLWSHNKTSKGLRHIQVKENFIKENIDLLSIQHIQGKINPADILSKEDKDPSHFVSIRNNLVPKSFPAVPKAYAMCK